MKFITLFAALLFSFFGPALHAQSAYLTLVIEMEGDAPAQVEYFPEGTRYEVLDQNHKAAEAIDKDAGALHYPKNTVLVLYPEWRKEGEWRTMQNGFSLYTTDTAAQAAGYSLKWKPFMQMKPRSGTKKRLRQTTSSPTGDAPRIRKGNGVAIGSVRARKELYPSDLREDQFNLILTFDNGIVFKYTDGDLKAELKGQDLEISGRYVIESEKGTAKVSFDPSSGEVWYIFEDRK